MRRAPIVANAAQFKKPAVQDGPLFRRQMVKSHEHSFSFGVAIELDDAALVVILGSRLGRDELVGFQLNGIEQLYDPAEFAKIVERLAQQYQQINVACWTGLVARDRPIQNKALELRAIVTLESRPTSFDDFCDCHCKVLFLALWTGANGWMLIDLGS